MLCQVFLFVLLIIRHAEQREADARVECHVVVVPSGVFVLDEQVDCHLIIALLFFSYLKHRRILKSNDINPRAARIH